MPCDDLEGKSACPTSSRQSTRAITLPGPGPLSHTGSALPAASKRVTCFTLVASKPVDIPRQDALAEAVVLRSQSSCNLGIAIADGPA
jgi:hypothetical protein